MGRAPLPSPPTTIMPTPYTKIGFIQNAPMPGDFSVNLRAIVQGYRECLDHGAELVIAPAEALCGSEPGDLIKRRSYIRQMRQALDALSRELGSAPLLTCLYSTIITEEELWDGMLGEEDADPEFIDESLTLVPVLLEHNCVTELDDGEQNFIDDHCIYISISPEGMLPDLGGLELMVHFDTSPWHMQAPEKDAEERSWEARSNGTPVACVRAVGVAGSSLYAGGSVLYNAAGKCMLRMPLFRTAAADGDLRRAKPLRAFPEPEERLRQALVMGIRDTVRHNGYSGVCLPLDHPASALLAALACEALGAGNVCGISFSENRTTARALGCDYRDLSPALPEAGISDRAGLEHTEPLTARLQVALMQSFAEERGLMLLSPLNRRDIMLGNFTLYGDSCGLLAPLGKLYPMDVYLLSRSYSEEHSGLFGALTPPPHAAQNRILHELADLNVSAGELIAREDKLFNENDVRYIQRRIIASAFKRSQLPLMLSIEPPVERLNIPICHRLND